jgi:hypothetical protein
MQDYEKLGLFYLGRRRDEGADDPVLYDSRDLVTHAVIIGMTGSGKTGLGIGLLEEMAIDGVPAIAIDPKGDLANLALTFPDLDAASFRPWVNEEDAARRGLSADALAEEQATAWREGLARSGQDGARIARFRDAARTVVYTPGSSAGVPISIVGSFTAPPAAILDDSELLAERIETSVGGLLTLLGLDGDALRGREGVLLSNILHSSWRAGESLDLAALLRLLQDPPFTRVGVIDLESFYPAKERFELAMKLNGLLASPSFAPWLEGEPLDIGRLLYGEGGKPRLAIVSIAHLGDAQRMSFVAMLLGEIVAWMRRQSGTSSLRAVLYMDEVAGYLPPVAMPPSKPPLLVLLKQARAFGLGVVLSTQNPIDLDYKALSNAGTWFLGRLQTEQDKARVLDGIAGAMTGAEAPDRATLDRLLSGLGKRVFLMHNVHRPGPALMETRWTLSYLRGPLTREQLRRLRPGAKAATSAGAAASTETVRGPDAAGSRMASAAFPVAANVLASPSMQATAFARPLLPPGVREVFLPSSSSPAHYRPMFGVRARVRFDDAKLGIAEVREVARLVPFAGDAPGLDWSAAIPCAVDDLDAERAPAPGAAFEELPATAATAKNHATWAKEAQRRLAETECLELLREPVSRLVSRPGESERDFRIRLAMALKELRDAKKDRLEAKYAPKLAAMDERVRRAAERHQREAGQASQQKLQAAVSIGAAIFGALLGRRGASSSVGRAATAARGLGRVGKEADDVEQAEEAMDAATARRDELHAALAAELAELDASADASSVPLEPLPVAAKKSAVTVESVAIAWLHQA